MDQFLSQTEGFKNYPQNLQDNEMAYLPRTVRVAFMALSCSKCDDMSVANTISTTRVRKSLKKSFIALTWKSEVDRYGIRQVKYGV